MERKDMVGKTLVGVQLAKDKQAIKFNFEGGESVVAKCDGDCCSHTWIENVELPSLPGVVNSAEDIPMPQLTDADDYGVVAYYGFKMSLSTGDLIIDYRNESNGYYGGNLSWPEDSYFYGGVYGQNISKEEWVEANEQMNLWSNDKTLP